MFFPLLAMILFVLIVQCPSAAASLRGRNLVNYCIFENTVFHMNVLLFFFIFLQRSNQMKTRHSILLFFNIKYLRVALLLSVRPAFSSMLQRAQHSPCVIVIIESIKSRLLHAAIVLLKYKHLSSLA